MFINGIKQLYTIVFILFLFPAFAFSQTGGIAISESKSEAEKLFKSEEYSDAYDIYKSLLERYPKDGMLNYYTGICLYKIDGDLTAALEYLEYASSKSPVPGDVFYHLGQAYKKNYQFNEAKDAFKKFSNLASRSEIKELQPDLEVLNASNALTITMEYNPFEILATSLFTFADSSYVQQVRGKGGRMVLKHPDFFVKGEKQEELTSFMFLPRNMQKGDYIFLSGYNRSRKKNADLFRVKKANGKNWGSMDGVEALNTEYDEILPYFDPVSNDLYFASRGHNSMGGFDIFKSHYDRDRDSWSDPINLGFPVNSPDNEYLAMPGPDLGTILLITDRQGLDTMLTVYKLVLQEPKKSLASADFEELKKIGKLGGITAIPEIVDMTAQVETQKPDADEKLIKESDEIMKDTRDIYEINVASALSYQKKSDSLSMLAKKTRVKVRKMPNPDDRWAWQRQIIEWEKASRDYKEKADEIFAVIENSEEISSSPMVRTAEIPPTIEADKEINGITLYKYTSEEKTPESSLQRSNNEKIIEENPELVNESGDISVPEKVNPKPFAILKESPYGSSNPFPVESDFPEGAYYKIQLGVFSKTISWDTFGGISPVTAEPVEGKELTRYYAGKFHRYEDARAALSKVKSEGFNDAYIVSWYNGKKTSVNKVIELEERDRP